MAWLVQMPAMTGRALGLVLIFLTAIIWVAASFVSQLLVTNEEGRTNFNVPPFLLTYLSTSVFTVFLPLVQLKSLLQETWLLRRSFKYKPLQDDEESAPIAAVTAAAAAANAAAGADGLSPTTCQAAGGLTADLEMAEAAAAAEQASAAVKASRAAHKEALTAAAQCFLLWFVAQFLFNQSLKLTSVTSNTILSSTSSLFTFALSMIFLREPYSMAKLLSIAACIGGTLLVTLSDDSSSGSTSSSVKGSSLSAAITAGNSTSPGATSGPGSSTGPSHSVWGDMLCLVSAAFYACYTIVLRKALPDDDEANVALFFGYVGLLCSIAFAPVVALLAGIGALHLKMIPSKAYLIILVQGILNYCLSDYLWAHAVLLLGPTIATLGLSVQIPVAAVVEALIGHPKWLSSGAAMAMTLSGTALIMAGFVAGNLAGGGHVYGSHHREDHEADALERRGSPGRLEDDSFTGNRHSPISPARRGAANGTSHSPQRNGVFRSSLDADSDPDEGDMPQSPLLYNTKQQQQQQQQHFAEDGLGLAMPVSTHARILPVDGINGHRSSSSSSSPGRRQSGPSWQSAGSAAAAVTAAAAGSEAQHAASRSPRTAVKGVQQLLPAGSLQQQQQHVGNSHCQRQPQASQQWESIELSSSPFSTDSKSEHGSPSALAALRPKEQLPLQPSPLRPAPDSIHAGADAPTAAESAAAAIGTGSMPQGQQQWQQQLAGDGDTSGQPSSTGRH